jgi:hypothetical protein
VPLRAKAAAENKEIVLTMLDQRRCGRRSLLHHHQVVKAR